MTPFDFALPRFAQGEGRHPAATAVDQFLPGWYHRATFFVNKGAFPRKRL